MATTSSPKRSPSHQSRLWQAPRALGSRVFAWLHSALSLGCEFWQKANNDWIFNLAAMLAYNFLISIIPVALLLLAIAAFFVGNIQPGGSTALQHSLAGAFPSRLGGPLISAVAQHLRSSAPALFILGIATSFFTGSGLFVAMENSFGVIFRLRGRDLVHLNVMAICMLLLYIVLVPVVFLGSIVPAALLRTVDTGKPGSFGGFLIQAAGVGVSLAVAFVLFAAIYIVVPNMHVHWRAALTGTAVASLLLGLYEIFFPIYVSTLLHPTEYGSVAGFLLVILLFFYYLSFILLLGAEVMSWAAGQRRTPSDITGIMHEVQAHNTLLGAAGETAGQPSEDLQHHLGATAMRDRDAARHHESVDHRDDAPPKELTRGGPESPSA